MATNSSASRPLRSVLAGLLIASAVLFAIGVAREHATHHETSKAETSQHVESAGGEANEQPAEHATRTKAHENSEARVLGVDTESRAVVALALMLSIGLAIAVMLTANRLLIASVAAIAGVATIFDLAQVVHQTRNSQTGLALIAIAVAVLHGAAVLVAARLLQHEPAPTPTR